MTALSFERHCLRPAIHVMARWQNIGLAYKRATAAAAILLAVLAGLAAFLSHQLAAAAVERHTADVALYTDGIVAPLIQETARNHSISETKKRELDNLFAPTVIKRPIVSFRIWVGNHIIYSNSPELIGKEFHPSPSREQAWDGIVTSEINQLESDDDAPTRALNLPIFEVYTPLRESVTGRVFALAETHEIALDLLHEIRWISGLVWFAFAVLGMGITSTLFILLNRNERDNDEARAKLLDANRRMSGLSEAQMQRMAIELHSGPVQLVGLSLLKLDQVQQLLAKQGAPGGGHALEAIRSALENALEEMASLTETLVPSRVETLSLAQTIGIAVRRHELRTGTHVNCDVAKLPLHVPFPVKAGVYKIILEIFGKLLDQETVQSVSARSGKRFIEVDVNVIGLQVGSRLRNLDQWLESLRDKIEPIGGTLFIGSWFGGITFAVKVETDMDHLND